MNHHKQRSIRPTRKLLTCALASCLMLSAAPAAWAQSTGATLRGQVSADSAPATDARVTATNLATGPDPQRAGQRQRRLFAGRFAAGHVPNRCGCGRADQHART